MLSLTEYGSYCRKGNFFIDPWNPVDYVIITHAHTDHARPCYRHYLAHDSSEGILRHRLGEDISLQTLNYGQEILLKGVRLSLHPAGHIPGSARIRLELRGNIGGNRRLQSRRRWHFYSVLSLEMPYTHHRMYFRPSPLLLA